MQKYSSLPYTILVIRQQILLSILTLKDEFSETKLKVGTLKSKNLETTSYLGKFSANSLQISRFFANIAY